MARHELTDAQFALIAPLVPTESRRGRLWNDHQRPLLETEYWHTPWRDIPDAMIQRLVRILAPTP